MIKAGEYPSGIHSPTFSLSPATARARDNAAGAGAGAAGPALRPRPPVEPLRAVLGPRRRHLRQLQGTLLLFPSGLRARARHVFGDMPPSSLTAVGCLVGLQVCQLRAGFIKDEEKREAIWEQQHEIGAQKMYSLCSELGGLFLKVCLLLSVCLSPSDGSACLLLLDRLRLVKFWGRNLPSSTTDATVQLYSHSFTLC